MSEYLPRTLDWGMASFGGRIELSDCASQRPEEWDYQDLEIFFTTGRCHHLALAMVRTWNCRVGVLFETDEDDLDGDPWIPHHVFAVDRAGLCNDIRGRRSIAAMQDDFAGTVGLVAPKVVIMSERALRDDILGRHDEPLIPATEADVAFACRVLPRFGQFARDHRSAMARFAADVRQAPR